MELGFSHLGARAAFGIRRGLYELNYGSGTIFRVGGEEEMRLTGEFISRARSARGTTRSSRDSHRVCHAAVKF